MKGRITFSKKSFSLLLFSVVLSSCLFAQNPIVVENSLPGNPFSEWGVSDFKDNRIAGFATKMSLNAGETVRFKIDVPGGGLYTIKIYRIGYYAGNGARLIQNLGSFNGTAQPPGINDAVTGMINCSNWSESATWTIPSSAVSGLYIAKLERNAGGSNHIVFIVRNDASTSDLYLQFPDATWQAYNGYGGANLYNGNTSMPGGHATKVSYNRPFFVYNVNFNNSGGQSDWYMNAEYPMIRWLERNGYDVTYTSSNDVANNLSHILNHKVFMTVGHDEYVSKQERNNIEAARNAGVHMAFFTGNEVYWKTRWENFEGSENRTLVCYKEGTLGDGSFGLDAERSCGYKCDNTSPEWTGLWRMGADYDAGRPENGLTGQISWDQVVGPIQVPSYYKKLRFWRNTTVANLAVGQTATLAPNTVGYEWDYEQYFGSYPPGRITMSSTILNNHTHKLSLYRHASGALVFGAGTVQWSWGLDGQHFGGTTTVSAEMQQATVNLFADMGVQPGTLQPGLTGASQSTDLTLPTSTITSPSNNSSFVSGATITFAGTASDVGGMVAAVEISVDGGATWSQASIDRIDVSANWTYTWTATSDGSFNVKCRGVDDSGNKGNGGVGINITVGVADNTPPSVVSVSPTNGSTEVSIGTTVVANFNEAISAASVTGTTFQLKNAANNVVSATLNTNGSQITLTPSSSLAVSTTYTATVKGGASGVKDLSGNALASDYSWSFTTAAAGGSSTYTVFQPTDVPTRPLLNDGVAIELGMKFRSSQNGYITGIRFYKGAGTTGTHIGQLWSSTGTLMGQATFVNETASGWQQVLFSTPIAITANVTYVAAYHSSSGDYPATNFYFTQPVVNGPLRALADGEDGPNGLYLYSPTPAFPTDFNNGANYWVDVVFNAAGGTGSTLAITLQPVSQIVCAGTSVAFNSASNDGSSTVQWQSSTNGSNWTNIANATNATLTFTAATSDNAKQYRAVWTNGEGSVSSNAAILTVNAKPVAPVVTVANNCGNSVLTASGFTGSLLWSIGATTASITVTTGGTYTVTQTVDGCTGLPGSGTAAPINSSVAAPAVTVANNCGNSVLTASGFTGSLLWSTGATTTSITVSTGGTYTVTQTVDGCTSPLGSGAAAPKPIPVLTSSLTRSTTSGVLFSYTPTSSVSGTTFNWTRATVAGISNAAASGSGNVSETLTNTTTSPVNVTYVYTLTVNGCSNTQNVVVTVNPATVVNCEINAAITSSFNSTAIPAGRYIWFSSVFDRGSLGTGTGTVTFNVTNSVITFTANGQPYTLNVPNSRIRFDASVTSASTQFVNNIWETVVPRSFSNYVFMGGLSYLVPSNLPGNISNVRWTAKVSIDKAGISLTWRWAAAVYSSFAGHAGLNVKPINGNSQNPYNNSDRAGTPENFKPFVVAGAKGGGGTNYTGNYSSTSTATCAVPTGQRSSVDELITPIIRLQPLESLAISEDDKSNVLQALALPNPTSDYFNLVVKGDKDKLITIRIIDIFGRIMEQHDKVSSKTTLDVGHNWVSGTYFAEVIQGDQRKIIKIIKAK